MKIKLNIAVAAEGYKKGDRVVVKESKDNWYIGTVQTSGVKLKIVFDDGATAMVEAADFKHIKLVDPKTKQRKKVLTDAEAKAMHTAGKPAPTLKAAQNKVAAIKAPAAQSASAPFYTSYTVKTAASKGQVLIRLYRNGDPVIPDAKDKKQAASVNKLDANTNTSLEYPSAGSPKDAFVVTYDKEDSGAKETVADWTRTLEANRTVVGLDVPAAVKPVAATRVKIPAAPKVDLAATKVDLNGAQTTTQLLADATRSLAELVKSYPLNSKAARLDTTSDGDWYRGWVANYPKRKQELLDKIEKYKAQLLSAAPSPKATATSTAWTPETPEMKAWLAKLPKPVWIARTLHGNGVAFSEDPTGKVACRTGLPNTNPKTYIGVCPLDYQQGLVNSRPEAYYSNILWASRTTVVTAADVKKYT